MIRKIRPAPTFAVGEILAFGLKYGFSQKSFQSMRVEVSAASVLCISGIVKESKNYDYPVGYRFSSWDKIWFVVPEASS